MIDETLRPWLIEVNTNPCLELSSSYLANLIPAMLENAFKIAIDPIFPRPTATSKRKASNLPECSSGFPENKFELIFHSRGDGEALKRMLGPEKIATLAHEDPLLVECSDEEENELESDDETSSFA
jgi:hypothetical protein